MKQPNTVEEALEIAFEKLGELRHQGVQVTMAPSKSRFIEDTIQKYKTFERLKPAYWFNINLKCENKDQYSLIFDAANELSSMGIGFDTDGGMCGDCGRTWEFDWSFHLSHINSKHMNDMRKGRKIIEDLLNNEESTFDIDFENDDSL